MSMCNAYCFTLTYALYIWKSPRMRFLLIFLSFTVAKPCQIWVVDANDHGRLEEARSELDTLMQDEKLKKVPLLVLANKSDLIAAKNAAQVISFILSTTGLPWPALLVIISIVQTRCKQLCKLDSQVSTAMNLQNIKERSIKCYSVSAKTGDGLKDAIDWAVTIIAEKKKWIACTWRSSPNSNISDDVVGVIDHLQ